MTNNDFHNAIQQEQLRQIKTDFNLYCIGFVTSLAISAIGGGMLLGGHTTEGAFTTATGTGLSAMCAQKKRDAETQLEDLMETGLEQLEEGE